MILNIPPKYKVKLKEPGVVLGNDEYTIIYGVNDSGKTHLACHMAYEALFKCHDLKAAFTSAEGIITDVYGIDRKNPRKYEAVLDYINVDILIIDEFLASKRQVEEPGSNVITEILIQRGNRSKRTILTTNKTVEEMKAILDGRLVSRLLSNDRGTAKLICKNSRTKDGLGGLWEESEPSWWNDARTLHNETKVLVNLPKFPMSKYGCIFPLQRLPDEAWIYIRSNFHENQVRFLDGVREWLLYNFSQSTSKENQT